MVTRRGVIAGGAALTASGTAEAAGDPFSPAALAESLARYIGFGVKHSGGAGDIACGEWLEETLRAAGFATERQSYETPFFEAEAATLTTPAGAFALLPQAPVVVATVTGPLAAQTPGAPTPRGAVAVATLPHARWSTSVTPVVGDRVAQAARDGAAALLLVTSGPTGEAVALNVPTDRRWPLPVAILAPRDALKLADAIRAGAVATYAMRGRAGMRPAFNLVGSLERGGRRVVISTPRSGWTVAAGERGGGVAVWRALAQWAPRALRGRSVTMIAASGHEYENFGAAQLLASALAPKPAETHLWFHLGANVAARDWHELATLQPLPSVDPQRLLVATPNLVDACAEIFRGAPGLERVYPAAPGTPGELGHVLDAGYPRAFGILGSHRFHHVAGDDARCVDAALLQPTALMAREAVRRLA